MEVPRLGIHLRPNADMISESTLQTGPDQLLHLLRSEYLRRLARFALIDDVPAPWGLGAPTPGTTGGSPAERADG